MQLPLDETNACASYMSFSNDICVDHVQARGVVSKVVTMYNIGIIDHTQVKATYRIYEDVQLANKICILTWKK
jgi:hypothetical protein